jgi:2-iminobutanoate/2-iminopropanoate deaminase
MKQRIEASGAPAAAGPYSQAIAAAGFVFCAGQVGVDPATGALVEGGVEAQAERVLRNLTAVLEAAGLTLDDVVKTTCFLADIGDFAAFNAVYARYFGATPPARSTFQVAALPFGARVEIEAIAARPEGSGGRREA